MEETATKVKVIKIDVEHCGQCAAHGVRCRELQRMVQSKQLDTKVVCRVGRRSAFEVYVNGILVHSKLRSHSFPTAENILRNVQNVRDGLPPDYSSNWLCNVM